ncbi:MAG: MobV family relaxase [Bacilli bacterium]|nr:MobV family relaxase [Bacilli bacterium]
MSYAIFRSKGIKTLNDLSQIGSHNQRTKDYYKSNPNIRIEDSKNNIELISCEKKYINKFYEITKEYQKEFNERMKIIRSDRKKSFYEFVNSSKGVVADEMIFTSDEEFFKNMSREDMLKWANESINFVIKDLGYKKEQILHATLHLDEKTPHIHLVVIPLVKKFDKRCNKEVYSISKRMYIKDKIHLSKLQDKYYERLINRGFKLERGEKNTGIKNIETKQFKSFTRYVDRLSFREQKEFQKISNDIKLILSNAKRKFNSAKVTINGEEYNILLDYFNMYSEKVKKQIKNEALYNNLSKYTTTYSQLETKYKNLDIDHDCLQQDYINLKELYSNLRKFMYEIFQELKDFFREFLLSKTNKEKEEIIEILKQCYKNEIYNSIDIRDITKDTNAQIITNNLTKSEEKDYDYLKIS